jgi:hypothetical protein
MTMPRWVLLVLLMAPVPAFADAIVRATAMFADSVLEDWLPATIGMTHVYPTEGLPQTVLFTRPCAGTRPETGDYFDAMQKNIERLLLQCCENTIGPLGERD